MKIRMAAYAAAIFALMAQQAFGAAPIDEFRLASIEQSIRTLQMQLNEQARLIDDLRRQLGAPGHTPTPERNISGAARVTSDAWLNAANWKRLRNGMTELEVVSVLGPPTQMRVSDDKTTRTLLYALEIGGSGFLSGNVVFTNGGLSAVTTPVLK